MNMGGEDGDTGSSSVAASVVAVKDRRGIHSQVHTTTMTMTAAATKRPARENRSVADYGSDDAIRKALMTIPSSGAAGAAAAGAAATSSSRGAEGSSSKDTTAPGAPVEPAASSSSDNVDISSQGEYLDWVLPAAHDPETTEVQSLSDELRRLHVLNSYSILDADREAAFERITALASRFFDAPIALISLVDLGRQWFLSNLGLGDVRETPRKLAFCGHAILSTHEVFVVTDATADYRFKDSPLVTGPPNIRFYAGAPLISPEGFKLGTVCVIDNKIRPAGLSDTEKVSLMDFAAMTVKTLVDRRYRLQRQESPAQLIAYTAHDLNTLLTGVQLSLSLLKEDEDVQKKLDSHQKDLINTSSNCAELMTRICQTAIASLRAESSSSTSSSYDGTSLHLHTSMDSSGDLTTAASSSPAGAHGTTRGKIRLVELIRSLLVITHPIAKSVPIIMTVDPATVPASLPGDDLKVFRVCLNLLTFAVERTPLGWVHMRVFASTAEEEKTTPTPAGQLVFEISDTGTDIPVEEYQYLFKPEHNKEDRFHLGLHAVASLVASLKGECGFRPRIVPGQKGTPAENNRRGRVLESGSVFWFSVPICPSSAVNDNSQGTLCSLAGLALGLVKQLPLLHSAHMDEPMTSSTGQCRSFASTGRIPSETTIYVHDQQRRGSIHADLKSGCLAGVFAPTEAGSSVAAQAANDDDPAVQVVAPVAAANREGGSQASPAVVAANADDFDQKMPASAPRNNNGNPNAESSHSGGDVSRAAAVGPRERKALVIDDSLVVRKSLAAALRKLGYKVDQAINGLEGLACLKENVYELCLLDFMMPLLDGIGCVKQFREWEKENRSWDRQLVIGISAHASTESGGNEGIAAGMDEFRPKPITIKLLAEINKSDSVVQRTSRLDERHGYAAPPAVAAMVEPEPSEQQGTATGRVPLVATRSLDALQATTDVDLDRSDGLVKRRKTNSSDNNKSHVPICLIATDTPTMKSNEALQRLESGGWKVVVVHDCQDALRLLKMRNWDAVLIDDDVPPLSGDGCISSFRQWENQNRVSRQRNVLLVCDGDIPSPTDPSSVVQPPSSFNGVLRKPVDWGDLQYMLKEGGNTSELEIIVRKW